MRRHITRVLYAAAATGIALATLGFAGAGSPATATARSLGPPVYDAGSSGYLATGRWFRYVSAAVTVPPTILAQGYGGNMIMNLANTPHPRTTVIASILVRPGGGAGSVNWGWGGALTPFAVSPKVGDQLSVSIYYDRHGHASFAVTDLTQGITRTARANTGNVTFSRASLTADFGSNGPWPDPATDTRLWKVAGTHLTTYTATRGTLTGPWQTSQVIQTSTGTAAGTVISSPSGLWNGGANFGVWLRHH